MCLFDLKASQTVMGHRRSHTHARASKRGSPEMVSTYHKDKHDINEEGSKAYDGSRRGKREHKRREHEDSSKKKHNEKHKGKNRHHRTKEKPKDKVSRRKDCMTSDNLSSESESSTSFLRSRRDCRHHRSRSHSPSRSRSHSRSHSRNADPRGSVDVSNTHRLKRFKGNNEALSMDDIRQIYKAPNNSMQVEKEGLQRCVNAQLVQVKDTAEGAELKRCCVDIRQDGHDGTIPRNQEQEKRLDGRKDKGLEVELRQRALLNFLRHQDVSCKMDEHKERIDKHKESISPTKNLGVKRPAPKIEHSEQDVTDVAGLVAVSDAVNGDTLVDVCANDVTAHPSLERVRESNELVCNSRSNLEEGEIISDNENETGNENAHCLMDESRIWHDKENTESGDHASKCIQKEQHELRSSTAGEEIERLSTGVNVAPTCITAKQELSQGKAVEGSLNGDATTPRHDVDTSFQQKTMSVIRGGEIVQVSYKVYIPKRAAELARRRLQR